MRDVLIVGFLWPYIGGSKRVIGLAQYLPEFGWQPVVLTAPLRERPPTAIRIVEAEYRGLLGRSVRFVGLSDKFALGDQLKERVRGLPPAVEAMLRRGFDLFREVVAYPDEHKRWIPHALAAADWFIAHNRVHALLSIWPWSTHLIARELKRRHSIPWAADLADLWSQNSAYPYGQVRKWFDRRLEVRTLADVDALTTSSTPLAERLGALHGRAEIPAILIGFDPQIINHAAGRLPDRFTITYTGVFYAGKRDPLPFFKALGDLLAERRIDPQSIEVRIYGPEQAWVRQEIEQCGVAQVVRLLPTVPYEEVIRRQRESHVLLQVNWSDASERGVFSGKLLDYLAAARPVLAAGGAGKDEVVIGILRETNAGVYVVTIEEIKTAIMHFYLEYQATGTVVYTGNLRKVERYSNRAMAGAFAAVLDQIAVEG